MNTKLSEKLKDLARLAESQEAQQKHMIERTKQLVADRDMLVRLCRDHNIPLPSSVCLFCDALMDMRGWYEQVCSYCKGA